MSDDTSGSASQPSELIDLTTDIVSAYVSNNRVSPADLPALLASVHATIGGLGKASVSAEADPNKPTPSQIRKSIKPNGLTSFIDGKQYQTLKRHLTVHGMTIDEYRERYGLPRDYPTTSTDYSARRSALAKSTGLGQQRRNAAPKVAAIAETLANTPKARGRKKDGAPAVKPARSGTAK
jgi:predicted transcriptional regulator